MADNEYSLYCLFCGETPKTQPDRKFFVSGHFPNCPYCQKPVVLACITSYCGGEGKALKEGKINTEPAVCALCVVDLFSQL